MTPATEPVESLKVLADPCRWSLLTALTASDRRVQELVDLVRKPPNLVSYHLRRLRDQAMVRERRSAADRRDIYYSLNFDRLEEVFMTTQQALHPGLGQAPGTQSEVVPSLGRQLRVLFLCTHNSARSQMAEAILRHLSNGSIEVHSAGTEVTQVHPLAAKTMAARGFDTTGQSSKRMDEFLGQHFDYVVTVCDNARETCPIFPGAPERIHWSIADPSQVGGSDEEREAAFRRAADELQTRIRYLLIQTERQPRP